MKLKVKQKSSEKQPLILILIVTVIFASIGIGIVYELIKMIINFDLDEFVTEFSAGGFNIFLLMGMGCFGFYFVYLLFKPPLKCLGILTSKKEDMYKGKKIWNLKFKINSKNKDYVYSTCYTEEENTLEKGQKYIVCYKEYTNKIVKVLEYDENFQKLDSIQAPTLVPVFYFFFFVFGCSIVFLIFKFFYDITNGNDVIGNLFVLALLSFILYGIYNLYKAFISDSEDLVDDRNIQELKFKEDRKMRNVLARYPRLKENNRKVPSVFKRMAFYSFFKYFIAWIIFILFVNIVVTSESGRNFFVLLIDNFKFYCVFGFFCVFFGFLNILFLLSYRKYDEKLFKKYNISVGKDKCEINDLKKFRIFRPTMNKEYQKYYIVDENNNLLYKVDSDGLFNNKYLIGDNLNNKVGEIVVKRFNFYTYVIRLINEEPFCIRRKVNIDYDYVVVGRDYEVYGENSGIINVICDNNEKELAVVSANKTKKENYRMGDSSVLIKSDVINSEELVFISLCVTLGNFEFK